jgi:hypothetical protein
VQNLELACANIIVQILDQSQENIFDPKPRQTAVTAQNFLVIGTWYNLGSEIFSCCSAKASAKSKF